MAVYELNLQVSEEDAMNLRRVSRFLGLSEVEALQWSLLVASHVAEVVVSGRALLVRDSTGQMTQLEFPLAAGRS